MQRPVILLLIPTLDRAGAEKQFTLLARGLPRDEFDVRVATLTRSGPYAEPLEQAGISVVNLQKRYKFDLGGLRRLRRLIRECQPDILHTWLFAANAYGRLAAGAAPKMRVVVAERCVDSWKAAWQHRIDRWLWSRTDRMIANSAAVAEFYKERGVPPDRIAVIPNGVEPPEAFSPEERVAARRRFCLPPQAKVIACVGRLARQKRVDDLIWAVSLLDTIRPDTYLLVAGDGPERAALERFARDVALGDRVVFPGPVDNVRGVLAAADLFCLASGFEGMSNSLMEAMALGLPVIASDIPPNRELIRPGECGLLVPAGDRAAFAREMRRLQQDSELAARLGNAARVRMLSEFSVERMVSAHVALYRALLASPPRS